MSIFISINTITYEYVLKITNIYDTDTEAELSMNDLAKSKNLGFEDLMNDVLLLKDICMEILSEVELTVENIDTGIVYIYIYTVYICKYIYIHILHIFILI
jgi:hypothetical protein